MKPIPLAAALVAYFASATLSPAEPVPVGDPSFEGNSLGPGGYTYDLGPEWSQTSPGSGNAFEEYIAGFAAEGTDHLGMELGYDVWQDLPVTYQANTRYTLTVAAGRRSNTTQPGNQSQYLLADSNGTVYATGIFDASTLPSQTFADAPALVFDTPANPAAVGKTIRILLQSRGSGRSQFDKIRLDADSLIPAGGAQTANLPATAVTATSATLNGQVLSIGVQAPAVTIFWGTSDGGPGAGSWEHSVTLPGTQTGTYSTALTGLTPGALYYSTSRATNSAGESWSASSESFETLPVAPVVNTAAATAVTAGAATVAAAVTSTGGAVPQVTIYYGTADGGTTAGNWASHVSLGPLSGAGAVAVTGLTPGATYHFRAFAQNAGGSAWAPASLSFTTLAVTAPTIDNREADGMTGTTATLRGEVTAAGNDPPLVTVFYGSLDGGTNPSAWAGSINAGVQSGDFTAFVAGLSPSTPYYFRSRAVNAGGTAWAPASATFTTTPAVPDTAVINEFHFKPADKTSLEEFIELYNPGDSALDLSGWSISDAVSYTFPAGTSLPAGGYLVVAEKPPVILAKYGKPALGPWTGKLSSSGERIDLKDAGGVLRDRVSYGVGFPWPTGPDGGGASAELINPALDNDLGGSWRASGTTGAAPVTYVASQATGWKYKKGTAEASNPVDAWRATAYNDSSWLSGTAGIGYGDDGLNTTLSDMRNGYRSVYFRKSFTVSADAIPDQLKLRVWVDDGCVIWINGTEVARLHVPAGQLAYNAAADNHEREWEELVIDHAGDLLFGGTNVIAVHGLNTTISSSDFSMDLELSSRVDTSPVPTPGAPNSVRRGLTQIPPQIRQVAHAPVTPAPGQPVTITARITDPDGMGAVSLAYQTVDPGAYIRLTDAAYATSWTTVPMNDAGANGDTAAGDSIYTAVLPAAVQANRRLVRYRITFADSQGNSQTVPYADDEQPNFAYYVYSGLPAWQGAFRPGSTAVETYPATLLGDLPVYSLIANGTDVINSQYNGGSDAVRFRGTFVSDGVVYDHIEFKNRGEASTYVSGKNKWRFFFNRARDLPAKDNFGRPYAETWGSLSGDACSSPWAALHRGMAGVEEATSYKIFQLAGVPSPATHYYHFRVVRGPDETPPAGATVNDPIGNADGQYAGDFWGLYLAVEQPDGSFLDERGLPDGSVYKIEGNAGDKKSQGATQPLDSSDWDSFRDAHVNGDPTEAWWRANLDMDAYYTFQALSRLTGNVDLRGGYNHYFYHRSSDNRWVPIPWDLDMMFIAKTHWTTNVGGGSYPGVINAYKSILQNPALALEYRNRAREILDLLASDPAPGGGQVGQLIDEFAAIVNPQGQALTWADADAAMWNLHPRTQGSDGSASGQTNHRGNFFRTPFFDSRNGGGWTRWLRSPSYTGIASHEDSMVYLRDYATDAWPGGFWTVNNGDQLGYGYQYLASEAADAAIPATPQITYSGEPGYPVTRLAFTSSAFSDPQGAASYAKTQWRLAEISGPGVPGYATGSPRKYEINSIWSTELSSAPGTLNLPAGLAEVGRTYRMRVRHQDSTGRWSHWSAPLQFGATAAPAGPLVHYWNFNNAAALLTPTFTTGGAAISTTLTGGAAIEASTGQSFAGANARHGDGAGSHLRVNNPLGATLRWNLPTTAHENVLVRYETRRSGQGAGLQKVDYSIDGGSWILFADIVPLDDTPVVQTLDFRGVAGVDDNPLFALRITFQQGAGGVAGNDRFDNLTVEADELPVTLQGFALWRSQQFPDPADLADPAISGPEASAARDGVSNLLRYALGVGAYDPVTGLLPTLASAGGSRQFRFRYDATKTDLVWRVTASPDLSDWSQALFDSRTSTIPPLEAGWLPVTLPDHLGDGPGPDARMFTRLEVQLAE